MYAKDMVTAKMKPVTVYLQEIKYLLFQEMAKNENKKAAELVRDAMDEYIENHTSQAKSLESWKPISLGGLKEQASDWISKDYQDEILGGAF